MKKDILDIIELPEGVNAEISDKLIKFKGNAGETSQKIIPEVSIEIEGRKIKVERKKSTKTEKKLLKSFVAHIKKEIKGANKKYVYKLQICFVHFPTTVTYDEKNRELIIKNFLGETVPRKAKILPNVDLTIEGDKITIQSVSKDDAGQCAANIEQTTKIRSRDKRIFQDGIWITEKNEKPS